MSWVFAFIIVFMLIWVWNLSDDIKLLSILNNENEKKIKYLDEQRKKTWKKAKEYEKAIYELYETKANLSSYILKMEYKEWFNYEKDPLKKFDAIKSYWVQKNFGDLSNDCSKEREKDNAFSFSGVSGRYMVVNQKNVANTGEYWSFKREFIDINYREYFLFVPNGDEMKYYEKEEIEEIMKGIR